MFDEVQTTGTSLPLWTDSYLDSYDIYKAKGTMKAWQCLMSRLSCNNRLIPVCSHAIYEAHAMLAVILFNDELS